VVWADWVEWFRCFKAAVGYDESQIKVASFHALYWKVVSILGTNLSTFVGVSGPLVEDDSGS
jgi:hypothetical protein